jgi:type VI secretion system protein ImpF
MSEKWGVTEVGALPLFDRLFDEPPRFLSGKREPIRTCNREQLAASIQLDVDRLLSTRCPVTGDVALSRERTILDYGLPDLEEGGRGTIVSQRERLQRLIASTIEAFEPRLAAIHVEVESVDGGRLRVLVEADVFIDDAREPIAFSLNLGGGSGENGG